MRSAALNRSIYVAMLVLLGVIFLSLNMCSQTSFRAARLDLTQDKIFTFSPGTLNVLSQLNEPVTLRFFYSRKQVVNYPSLRAYADRVQDVLGEMRNRANGKLILEIIEPEPYSEKEDQAQMLGLIGAPTADGNVIYFGLAGSNLRDGIEAIPFLSTERQAYLEYDLVKLIQSLSRTEKPKLGLVTNLPLDTGPGGLVAAMQGQSQPFLIYEELRQRFELEFLEQDFALVPDGISVLMLAHPRPLDEPALYALDQFVMRGGRILAFVDPHSEISLAAGASGEPVKGYTEASDLAPLLTHWGVEFDKSHIVADRALAMRVRSSSDPRHPESHYVLWLSVPRANLDRKDVVTASLDHLNIGTVGSLRPLAQSKMRFAPLVWSSEDSRLLDIAEAKKGARPEELLQDFKPQGDRHVIAARLSGPLKSAFPAPEDGEKTHLAATQGDANLIIFADSDILDDRFWVRTQVEAGQKTVEPVADNARFVLSALDNLMGSDDLIALRGRAPTERPFEVIVALQRQAEARYLAEQKRLETRIAEMEERLARLHVGEQGIPADKVAEETARFRAELLESRKALRAVQLELRRDVDTLTSKLRVLNVLLMPAIVVLVALLISWLRSWRRQTHNRNRRSA